MKQQTSEKTRSDVHNFDSRLKGVYSRLEKELTSENLTRVKLYHNAMIIDTVGKAVQDKISQIIFKQDKDDNVRRKFAISEVRNNLEGAKKIIEDIKKRKQAITSDNTSTYPEIRRDLEVLNRGLRSGFVSNRNLITTFSSAFTPKQIKEISLISFEGIQYCDPDQEGTVKQTLSNLLSEIDNLLQMLTIPDEVDNDSKTKLKK